MTRRELFATLSGVGAALAAFPALLRQKVDDKVLDADVTATEYIESVRERPWIAYFFDENGVCAKMKPIDHLGPRAVVPVWTGSGHFQNTTFILERTEESRRNAFYRYESGPLPSYFWTE